MAEDFIQLRIIQSFNNITLLNFSAVGGTEELHGVGRQVEHALEVFTHANRPGDRRAFDIKNVFDLIKNIDRLTRFTVHLVDEGDDRCGAQTAHVHQFDGAFLDTFRSIDHHQGRIDCGQGTIGVFREIGVTGGIQQVDDAILVRKLHHR